MKKIVALFSLIVSSISCQAQTEFKDESLTATFFTSENTKIDFKSILEKHKGKVIFIDIWASWCSDCLKAQPEVENLYQGYSEKVDFITLSCDKTYESWKKGIEKFDVKGEHYLIPDGMKGIFGKSIKLDWIPRYMIIDKVGKIAVFKAIEPTDAQIKETINKLIN